MSIKINIHPSLQHFTNDSNVIEVDGSTVGRCFEQLVKRFPDVSTAGFYKNGKLSQFVDVYINQKRVDPDDLATPTKDGDEIHILIMVAGG